MASLADVDAALGAGENLVAHDRALAALLDEPEASLVLEHRLVLALARSGAGRRAREEFEARRLLQRSAEADPALAEDLLALHARLAKDLALAATGDARRRWAAEAAVRYERAGAAGVSAYPVVNAASMAVVAGDHEAAHRAARKALGLLADDAAGGGDDYWTPATAAEAWLVLGDLAQAAAALERAASVEVAPAVRATTRRQFALLASVTGLGGDLLAHLPVPGVAHYAGHRLSLSGSDEVELRARIDAAIGAHGVGIGYGSLAGGADLLIAEALLARGAEVRAVLPFDREEFVERAVRPAGEAWVARFEAVADQVAPVHLVTDGPYRGDDCLYGHASRLAMGRAGIRARSLVTEPIQLAVWDGAADGVGSAGTGADAAAWQAAGHRTHRIEPAGTRVRGGSIDQQQPPRCVRAALFGDVNGFSRLGDDLLPAFFERVMGALGRVLDDAGPSVLYRNTWGDGLYTVVESAAAAATIAIELQAAMHGLDLAGAGLPDDLRLRLGGHAGPLFEAHDHVRDEPTYFGRAVTTAARIEPRTPEGEVYVTGAFAALLELEGDGAVVPEYVGHVPTAKGYGELPMYVLVAPGRGDDGRDLR